MSFQGTTRTEPDGCSLVHPVLISDEMAARRTARPHTRPPVGHAQSRLASSDRFQIATLLGFKRNYWLVVAALVGHGVYDFVHQSFIGNPGVPQSWSGFCLAFDVVLGAWLADCWLVIDKKNTFV